MKCNNCGNKIRNPLNFCPYCREPLNPIANKLIKKKRFSVKKYLLILFFTISSLALIYAFFLYKDKLAFTSKLTSAIEIIKYYSNSIVDKKEPNRFIEPITKIEFIFVKGGCFTLGDTFGDGDIDERPSKEVCVKDFYISSTEIPKKQCINIMSNNASDIKDPLLPVDNVNMKVIDDFLVRLNNNDMKFKFRLPMEAEWEYACRSGGKKEKISGTANEKDFEKYGWFGTNSGGKPHHVGTAKPNGLGLYDMSGNVWEWTQDDYIPDCYKFINKDNPICKGVSSNKVIRGGSWNLSERFARCSARRGSDPLGKANNVGFRVVAVSDVNQ
ncbi:MAG: formylglycine-generating enzyme family protein [Thermodesulfovibrionales bacterium]|nr:formylglycine-generating enzyme family protein [Thermodesulfovibrionales bacterium]